MKRPLALAVASVGLLLCVGMGDASAQYRGYTRPQTNPIYGGPRLNPYLSLTVGGDTGLIYQQLIKPQVDNGNAVSRIRQQVQANGQYIENATEPNVPLTTGHRAGFQTHYAYFMNNSTGTQGSKPLSGAKQTANNRKPGSGRSGGMRGMSGGSGGSGGYGH